jgi:hypothetical protein
MPSTPAGRIQRVALAWAERRVLFSADLHMM